jgi:bacteriocin-like protein
MEKIMSKTDDTEKTRELNDAELAAVSGGLLNAAIAGATEGAAKGAGPTGGAGPVTFRELANLLGELENQL